MRSEIERGSLPPFYLVVVVWGEQYRNYFLEYCLPSLLAPRNIPALTALRAAKYLIASTADDWEVMRSTAIFRELERHLTPVFIELPPKGQRAYWQHAIIGHQLCCDFAVNDKAYRIFTSPDAVFSDGTLERLHEIARDGAQAVLKLAMPVARTDLFVKTLHEMGLGPHVSARDTGTPLGVIAAPARETCTACDAWHVPRPGVGCAIFLRICRYAVVEGPER